MSLDIPFSHCRPDVAVTHSAVADYGVHLSSRSRSIERHLRAGPTCLCLRMSLAFVLWSTLTLAASCNSNTLHVCRLLLSPSRLLACLHCFDLVRCFDHFRYLDHIRYVEQFLHRSLVHIPPRFLLNSSTSQLADSCVSLWPASKPRAPPTSRHLRSLEYLGHLEHSAHLADPNALFY